MRHRDQCRIPADRNPPNRDLASTAFLEPQRRLRRVSVAQQQKITTDSRTDPRRDARHFPADATAPHHLKSRGSLPRLPDDGRAPTARPTERAKGNRRGHDAGPIDERKSAPRYGAP